MIGLTNKTAVQTKALDDAMVSAHRLDIRVRLLDLNHNYLDDLSDYFDGGVVTVDADADVTRALDLDLFDPTGRVQLEPTSAARTGIYIAHMISIVYTVTMWTGETWDVPVFCGPIDKVERDGFFISIKALGKETIGLSNGWRGRNFRPNQEKTTVIRWILDNMIGETKMSIPSRRVKIPKLIKLNSATKPWAVARALANTMNLHLFYDGAGVAQLRPRPKTPAFTFDGNWVTTTPKVSYDLSRVWNAVEVIGRNPEGRRDAPRYRAVAPRNHELSPWELGRGNPKRPRYIWKRIKDNSLTSVAECRELARKVLADGLMAGIDVKFEGIPHPRLQELDVVRLNAEGFNAQFVCRKFVIPLVAGENSSYGYLRRVSPNTKRRQTNRRKVRGGRA